MSSSYGILPDPSIHDCWFLTGPTAVGKSRVGLALARRIDAEILSLDSMAVYRGMDIGVAKPTQEQRAERPHHLIDICDPTECYSVSAYLHDAYKTIREIRERGKQVLFVGGTPLYLKALLRGLFEGPPADWELRNQIEQEILDVGLEALHQRLALVDPLSAARLHPHDKRRMIRALEVYRLTGQPISHLQLQFEQERCAEECKVFVLQRPRKQLHERIEQRVEKMFAADFLSEVGGLLNHYGRLGRTASQAIGYQEVLEHLQQERTLANAVEHTKTRTRQLARRQETWFRSLNECRFVPLEGDADPEKLVDAVLAVTYNDKFDHDRSWRL